MPPADDVAFIGHPRGLFYLAFTEAWERFSYYGMTALLALYMVNELLLPGHVEHIAAFAGFRAAVESLVGPLSTQALASQIFGLYCGFVYFTPLARRPDCRPLDRAAQCGRDRRAVDERRASRHGLRQTFLGALLLLVIGSGFLKGNISAQVGALYPREDEARRTRGFIDLQHGNQYRRGCRTIALRIARAESMAGTTASAWRRSSCSSAWRPICTDTAICLRKWSGSPRGQSAHRRGAAHHLRARRRDGHHDLPVDRRTISSTT